MCGCLFLLACKYGGRQEGIVPISPTLRNGRSQSLKWPDSGGGLGVGRRSAGLQFPSGSVGIC